MPLFQQSVIKKHIDGFNAQHIEEHWQKFQMVFHNSEKQLNIRKSNEKQYQSGFLRDLFEKVLGYKMNPEPNFNLLAEKKNVNDAGTADGAILLDGKVIAVIELKDTKTTNFKKIEDQAFGYKVHQPGCNYVITSNFEKLRFYIDNTTQYEEFNLFALTKAQFELLYSCLAWESIKNNVPTQLLNESVSKENTITKSLYKDYSEFKRALFANLVELNPHFDKLLLFKKTQKLLDRFLFIFFAEDRGLLPTNLIFRINKEWENILAQRIQVSLYDRYKMYFNDLNVGAKVTLPAFGKKTGEAITAEFEIFAYNGGLFVPDEILDNIKIDDVLLHSYTQKMSHYDFQSDVDVNILGHIFENSLNEIDEIKSEIEGNVLEKTKTRRKKDGVFYTPKYITKYIVDNTVGKLCTEKKEAINLIDEDFITDKKLQTKTKKALLDKLNEYRAWLLDLTICDPACGSGAFLNQALEFLIAEHRYVDELQAKLLGDTLVLSDIENSILERNIYGVDLNDESVEIAKLSLWLRTAQKGRKLNSLNNNIKCGNSLIDDPAVAGDKAFSWEKEFPEVFSKGGFDVVIGNPPYVDIKALDNLIVKEIFKKYLTAENRINLYSIFIEQGYSIVREGGILSFINPNSILINSSYTKIRRMLVSDMTKLIKLPDGVFEDATVETIIFEFRKNSDTKLLEAIVYNKNEKISSLDNSRIILINKDDWKKNDDCNYNIFITKDQQKILKKIEEKSFKLGDLTEFCLGITPYDKYKGHSEELIKNRTYHSDTKQGEAYKPLITGENITRFSVTNQIKEFINYGDWLGAPRNEKFFKDKRILVRQIVSGNPPRIYAGYTEEELYFTQIGFAIIPKEINIKYVLCLLNSNLMNFYHKFRFLDLEKELFQKILIANCKNLPIKKISKEKQINFEDKANIILTIKVDLHLFSQKFSTYLSSQYKLDKLPGKLEKWCDLEFVDFIKELNKAIKAVKGTPLTKKDEFEWMDLFEENKKKALELKAEIDKTDKEIDAMVYELYGLSEEEIKIVEGW